MLDIMICPECDGRGFTLEKGKCEFCKGDGQLKYEKLSKTDKIKKDDDIKPLETK